MRTEEQNRLQAPIITPSVKESIEAILTDLDREIKRVEREIAELFDRHPPLRQQRDLLISIPGIGDTTAARILGEMPNITEFRNVKAVAAYAGLSPRHYESGSIRKPSSIARTGNSELRSALYFPAITAMRFNPSIQRFAERLRQRGTEIVKGVDTGISESPVSNYAAASSVDGRLIQTSPGSVLQTG
jgi:transposase